MKHNLQTAQMNGLNTETIVIYKINHQDERIKMKIEFFIDFKYKMQFFRHIFVIIECIKLLRCDNF